MSGQGQLSSLESLLERLHELNSKENVSIDNVLATIGRRAFGPVLLIPGLIALSPLSGMPGVPTIVGVMVLLLVGQIFIGREELWLPQFVLRRAVSSSRYNKALNFLHPVARFVDKLFRPRLTFLMQGWPFYLIVSFLLLVSLIAPLLELVPFAITGVGAAVTAFALAIMADDGLLGILVSIFLTVTLIVVGQTLL